MNSSLSDHQRLALKMAARWFVTLCSGDVTPQQNQKWQVWLAQHEDHRWAWQRVESLQGQMHSMPGKFSYQTLSHAHRQSDITRRRVLKGLLVLLGLGGTWKAWQTPAGQGLLADMRTSTGEIKTLRLDDGSQLSLNTASAADIRFTPQQRLIRLHQGEIRITTARDPQPVARPFLVQTQQGMLRALGTDFIVRQYDDATRLAVLKHAVEVTLPGHPVPCLQISEGHSVRFTGTAFGEVTAIESGAGSWNKGVLSVSDRRLAEVVDELARYRHGHLSCDPAVADLRISGTFPLNDTDSVLNILSRTLPVKIQTMTRYWVNVVPA
ncbi:ferric citrate uptake sigma factor regulator FecR [Rahnella perminowiae]|uniref:ferric citrate uptake sigma factor regulator FecR n=1 Tax=Rahnella perminowiae TaxID=2816244 RepID=UPI001C253C18|nr:ferric citrate uptake sigma factor regulator FecR [Rahnella perminowiae]MBU9825470.1 fec operon regulator FecR [Rahnella perminowiae]